MCVTSHLIKILKIATCNDSPSFFQQSHISLYCFSSQNSLVSNASDGGTRHLALVFFDILLLNGQSVLHKPYSERRALLESLVKVIPGYAMLADRFPVSCEHDFEKAAENLSALFSKAIASHQEGLVLKADEGRYNDWKLPWVKVTHRVDLTCSLLTIGISSA